MRAGVNWDYWFAEKAIPLEWWSAAPPTYIYLPRLALLLLAATCIVSAAAFAAWCWSRWKGPIVLK